MGGGAGIVANGPGENIRSGDPGQTTTAAWRVGVQDGSHTITGISFSYQYVAGYGADGAAGGTCVAVLIASFPSIAAIVSLRVLL